MLSLKPNKPLIGPSLREWRKLRSRPLWAGLALIPFLAACSFSPAYQAGADGRQAGFGFQYQSPATPLAQIVEHELMASLPPSAARQMGFVTVTVSSSAYRVGRTSTNAVMTRYEAKLNGHLIVYNNETKSKSLFDISRVATAQYAVTGQLLADQAAHDDAEQRAARALAETLRLALFARFSGEPGNP